MLRVGILTPEPDLYKKWKWFAAGLGPGLALGRSRHRKSGIQNPATGFSRRIVVQIPARRRSVNKLLGWC